ncbi:MAG: DNA recombination protein RmuC [Gammaproteobacteria bacterium]|nr:DNA recombination protein RmuC [Gammaproteobacteria bacterium]NND39942.1 DNA recombination protein RmuC [Pseudomonadales bacterium]MBT8152145.1 DNA recombination protein RmuC [Gammaproteobacteria bacterium]NNL10521.1 DNA recombination protein RmuC [Pseudomonadales bacterium]NNM10657.1 DNA recombination protein RmuC [Pseudomonadales bacterium]
MQAWLTQSGERLLGWLSGLAPQTLSLLFFVLAAVTLVVFASLVYALYKRSQFKQRWHASVTQLQEAQQSLLLEQQRVAMQEQRLLALATVEQDLAAASSGKSMLAARGEQLATELAEAGASLSTLRADYAALEARTAAEQKAMGEQLDMLQKNREKLSAEFELLANRIFEEKSQKFSRNSQQQLDITLSPLKNQLDDFRKRVDFVYGEEAKERKVLQEQIKQLRAESLRISEDASNLTQALKADNKAQGNWGELTLVRALEICGLREPEEYETQTAYKAEDNSRQIPDVVVHLPGGKDIIIDSKVSLLAYARYFEAETDEERSVAMEQHLQSVRQHLRGLSAKSYQSLPGIRTLDYVMLYIPVEGASAMALQADRALWEEAYAKNIVLVSPTNLLAILRSVETIWRHEKQNKNAEEIARQAGNLHDKFVGLVASLDGIGRALDTAQSAYSKAYGQLSTGKGSLVSRVQSLEKLGAKTRQALPDKLLDAAGIEQHSADTIDSDLEAEAEENQADNTAPLT